MISINYTKARRKKQLTCIVIKGMGNTILLSFKLHTELGFKTQNILHRNDIKEKSIGEYHYPTVKLNFLLRLTLL